VTTTTRTLKLLPYCRDVTVEKPGSRKGLAHWYAINGVKYDRVTSALGIINKPALIPWAKKLALGKVREVLLDPVVADELAMISAYVGEGQNPEYAAWVDRLIDTASKRPDEVKEEAADRGTGLHQEIERYLTSEDRPAAEGVTAQAVRFLSDWDITIAQSEMTVWSDDLQVAGTCDGVGWNKDGELIIWDWKTGSGPWWEMALQLGAYSEMLRLLTGYRPVSAYVVKLTAEAYAVHRVTNLKNAWREYERAVRLNNASKLDWWE